MKTEQSKNEGLPAGPLQSYTVTGAAITSTEVAALEVLRETGVGILEAALIAKSALEAGRGRVKRAWECIEAGAETLRAREKTVTFEWALEAALEERSASVTRLMKRKGL